MNCHDFEVIAGDLSKEGLMEANLREKGLEHSASCANCAARLDEEGALTAGLRSFARTSTEEAPPSVEAAVLAAFRQHREGAPVLVPTRTSARRWIYAVASVAALVLITMLIALNASRTQEPQAPIEQTARDDEKKPVVPVVSNAEPDTHKMPSRSPKLAAPKTRARQNQQRGVVAQRALKDETDNNATTEIATDFIPLTNRETLAQMDGGQVMRVELPRSALMSFGLPMDMERAGERIKADVVVGNDGLARAIRFVR